MPRILLIAAIFLLIGTSVLGFLTRGKLAGLKIELGTTQATLKSTSFSLTETNKKLKTAQDDVTTAKATADAKEKEAADAKVALQKSEDQAKKVQETLTTTEGELTKAKQDLDICMKGKGTPTPEPGPNNAELDKVKAELQEKTALLAASLEKVKNLEGEVKDLQAKAAGIAWKSKKLGIEATVVAYTPSWNFVVLNMGDKQGMAMNAELIIKRDGARVATVKISAVEPNTSIGDVVPGSVTLGMKVQPGDKAIFEK